MDFGLKCFADYTGNKKGSEMLPFSKQFKLYFELATI